MVGDPYFAHETVYDSFICLNLVSLTLPPLGNL